MSLKSTPESASAALAAAAAITLYGSEAPGLANFTMPTPITLVLRVMVIAPCRSDEALEETEAVADAGIAVDAQLAVLEQVACRALALHQADQIAVADAQGRLGVL